MLQNDGPHCATCKTDGKIVIDDSVFRDYQMHPRRKGFDTKGFDIKWCKKFRGISWAYEKDKPVISMIIEDRQEALRIAAEINDWSDRFTRLTFIERDNDEFAVCCYQDPQISKNGNNIGMFSTGMRQSSGYEQIKPTIKEKSPLLQIAYAADVREMSTYEQISRLVPIRKLRIITEKDLKKQEYFYENAVVPQH